MTILTKPSLIIKKADVTESPLVHDNLCDEEKIDIHPAGVAWAGPKRGSGGLMCMSIAALLMAIAGIISGLCLYRQYLHTNAVHRYTGSWCIPMDIRQQEAALRWRPNPDVFVRTLDDHSDEDDMLEEKLDVGDTYEKVFVLDNGRNVEFIHDFNINLTGIVDEARCFMMQLDPSLVLPPARLIASIESGDHFDVSRVRSALRADLTGPKPDMLAEALLLLDACLDKPTYMLKADDNVLIRKRSADEPPHEFIQFSGKHVQEIAIDNMADVLAYERSHGRDALTPRAAQLAPKPAQLAPEQAQLAPEPAQFAPEPAQFVPEPANFAPEPAQLAPDSAQLAPEDEHVSFERAPLALPMQSRAS